MNPRRTLFFRLSTCCIVLGVALILAPGVWVLYTGREASDAQTAALAAWDGHPASSGVSSKAAPVDSGFVLSIPALRIRTFVPEGATPEHLRRYGVGRISWTPLPGEPGIVGIAGHRTTYGAPFFRLDRLAAGDAVVLDYGGRRYRYRVSREMTVAPDRVDALQDVNGQSGVALVTCTPPYSAAFRLIVFATRAETATRTAGP